MPGKKRSGPPPALVAAAVATAAAAVAVALARLGRPRRDGAGRQGAGRQQQHGGEEQTWSCPECGQEFRVVGEGRHRVYWLIDAGPDDPVLEGRCPNCGHPLPREQVAEAA